MSFEWTPHRFAGGALALDVANSVILRHDPARSIDRFADPRDLDRFPHAASRLSVDQTDGPGLATACEDERPLLIALREAIDRHFRAEVLGRPDRILLADLLEACAAALRRPAPEHGPVPLVIATATSALALLSSGLRDRTRICAHCGWLFIDRSKNKSRMWCDMAVCGNRVKAARHYRKAREASA